MCENASTASLSGRLSQGRPTCDPSVACCPWPHE